MKELSIEEKAKAYDKALKVLHKYDGANIMFSQSLKEEMFPELCELKDEKTKKEIINYLECQSRDEPSRKDTHNKWISYIEKYALSKDDYGFLRDCARVLKTFGWQSYADRLTALCPALGEEAKAMMSTPIIFDESEDERIRKFLTKCVEQPMGTNFLGDIKKEDVLSWLEKQGNLMKALQISNAKIGELIEKNYYLKEQLEKQGEQKAKYHDVCDKCIRQSTCQSDCFLQQDEQKPAWSEEDETALGDVLWCCKQAASIAKNENDMGNVWYAETWLKSLKDRVQPQNRWKPSNEQMQVLHWSMPLWIEPKSKAILESLINDLKKLREE